jgi:protein-tyrosine phosphatase
MSEATRVRILFVCMGNICRSPTAEGVFRHLLRGEGCDERIATDSAGTHSYHIGEPPDERARETALRRGIDLSDLRARRVAREDFRPLRLYSGHGPGKLPGPQSHLSPGTSR